MQFCRGKTLISGLSVLDILAQPRKSSGLAFVIVLSLKLVSLVVLPPPKHDFAFDGLTVWQDVFKVFRIKKRFRISEEVWVFGASVLPGLCSLEGR